jgi:C4-dicarboxylate transporter DctQ subunit
MFKRIDKVLSAIEGGVNGILLLSATILLFTNIVLRYFFHASTTWAEEAIRYAIIWVTFFGGSICAKNGMHVGIDIFANMLPRKYSQILLGIAQLLAGVFTAFLTYYGWQLTMLLINTGQRTPAIEMPMWIIYIALPVGGAMMTVRFLVAAIQEFTKDPDDGEASEVDLSRL